MNVFLWVLQGALALLFLAGGATKVFKVDELARMPAMRALPRSGWRVIGALEMLGGVLLLWPDLTPLAAAVLAAEALALAALYARHSLKLAASNPLVWSAAMGLVAAFVAYGRYTL